jgi:SAM-dependent methyltransferase
MIDYKSAAYRATVRNKIGERGYEHKKKVVLKHARGNVLELGCGEVPIFRESTKVDIAKIGGYIQADLNKPTPLKEKFDTIISLEVIGHLHNVDGFLKECYRLLNDSGVLILSSRNVKYWKTRLRLLFGSDKDFDNDGEYFWYFSPKSLSKKLGEHGFSVDFMHGIGRAPFLSMSGGFICVCSKIKQK